MRERRGVKPRPLHDDCKLPKRSRLHSGRAGRSTNGAHPEGLQAPSRIASWKLACLLPSIVDKERNTQDLFCAWSIDTRCTRRARGMHA